jgi:hypothetical protein
VLVAEDVFCQRFGFGLQRRPLQRGEAGDAFVLAGVEDPNRSSQQLWSRSCATDDSPHSMERTAQPGLLLLQLASDQARVAKRDIFLPCSRSGVLGPDGRRAARPARSETLPSEMMQR